MSQTQYVPSGSEVVQSLAWKWNVQGRIFIIGGLGFMFDAWDVSLNGILIPLLSEAWNLTPGQAAWIGTANLLGMALGAFVWATIADRIGRKAAFSATIAVFAAFTIAGVFAPNIVVFAILRFLAGFGLGGAIPVDYALVGEFTPRKHRGRVLTAMDAWWPVGAALAGFVSAWLVTIWADWRPPLLAMVLPAILLIFVRLWIPESPMFLIRTNQHDKAREVIDQLVKATGAKPVAYRLDTMQDIPKMSAGAVVDQLRRVWSFSWRTTLAVWLLFLTVMFVYYVSLQWLPTFLMDAGFAQTQAFLTTGGMAAIGLVGALLATVLVETTGRRPLLAIAAVTGSILLVIVAAFLHVPAAVLPLVLVYGLIIQVAIPVMYAYASELYPTSLRSSGFGWASAVSRISAGIGPLLFVTHLVPAFGLTGAFMFAAATVMLAVVAMFILAPETTGKDLQD
ncbi:MAG TPA: MFS transporter [Enteractinococcus helveticum]|uniref:MFS transporter n=1 Tax=Enteractinococcus helveticum TaxID=1837282 RepID=A0A921FK93_9MICC|nr:MFS transporter [Enteractinococcus helveticum]HJF13405.1 MFS transporter [Enteractinococcus helveticum]